MMGVALLLLTSDTVVNRQAIAHQDALEILTENGFSRRPTAAVYHLIVRRVLVGIDPQGTTTAANPPAGFISMNHLTGTKGF